MKNKTSYLIAIVVVGSFLFPLASKANEGIQYGTYPFVIDLSQPNTPESMRELWKSTLAELCKKESTSIFFDVDTSAWPLFLTSDKPPLLRYDKPRGVAAMQAIARATKRDWTQIGGIQVFSRQTSSPKEIDAAFDKDLAYVLRSLEAAAPDKSNNSTTTNAKTVVPPIALPSGFNLEARRALLSGSLRLQDLPRPMRDRLLRMVGANIPSLEIALLSEQLSLNLRIRFVPEIEYPDPESKSKYTFALLPNFDEKTQILNPSLLPMVPLGKSKSNALDFGDGEVLTASELSERATAAFAKPYTLNDTLASRTYFVSASSFDKIWQKLAATNPLKPSAQISSRSNKDADAAAKSLLKNLLRSDWKDLPKQWNLSWMRRKNLMSKAARNNKNAETLREELDAAQQQADDLDQKNGNEELPLADFLNYKEMTVGELSANRSGLAAKFASLGLDAETKVRLKPQIQFWAVTEKGSIVAAPLH